MAGQKREGKALGGAFVVETWRSWLHKWKPFCSILIISMLGVAVLTGIYAGCRDTFAAANRFYAAQGLHDIQVVSTMGLTDSDLDALRSVDGVERVQAERYKNVLIDVDGTVKNATERELGLQQIDQPYVQEGHLPTQVGEVAVTKAFLNDTGYSIGQSIDVEDADSADSAGSDASGSDASKSQQLTIVGVVIDPEDVTNPEGYSRSAFRATAHDNYVLYVAPDSLDTEAYAAISILVRDAENEDTFSSDYDDLVASVKKTIEDTVQSDQEQARHDELVRTAQDQLDQAKADALAQIPAALRNSPQVQAQIDEEFAQQQSTIDGIATPRWYVQTRTALGGFNSLKSDISSIESLGKAFPVVFLIVAVMMSLTTMSRLVEEDRGLVGTYLGLGYGRIVIALRYLLFALLACLIGGGLGLLIGFLGIPAFLLVVIRGLYVVPDMRLEYDWTVGSLGVLLFVLAVGIATLVACVHELRQNPANLMRPKAPKPGARILLERIAPIWKRMSFLNKVTARNIFRFKSRLIMTVGGVAGCTALIICGLAINDSVSVLGTHQFNEINQYDMLVVANDGDEKTLQDRVVADGKTTAIMDAHVGTGELTNAQGHGESIQLVVIPNSQRTELNEMLKLEPASSDSIFGWVSHRGTHTLSLTDDGILVAQSAAKSLGLHDGDEVSLQSDTSIPEHTKVSAVTRNLVGSQVYISETLYNQLFAQQTSGSTETDAPALTWNAIYAKLKGSTDDKKAYVQQLGEDADVLSAVSCAQQAEDFKFDLMGAVVALIVGLAGSLALVVLFTLAHTNVSERIREMATLKVLGFYDKEVHRYLNREMMIMTLMGIVVGLPLGRWVAGLLTNTLNMPSMYFEVYISPWSYLIAVVATFIFALIVQWFVNPVLDRIDPVSSLKMVE